MHALIKLNNDDESIRLYFKKGCATDPAGSQMPDQVLSGIYCFQ
jgi:hypothetical protein